MIESFNKNDLFELLDALFDNQITVEQHSRLQKILKSNPAARSEYLAYNELVCNLNAMNCAAGDLPNGPPSFLEAVSKVSSTSSADLRKTSKNPIAESRIALAACLLLAVGGFSLLTHWFLKQVDKPSDFLMANKQLSDVRVSQISFANFFEQLTPAVESKLFRDLEYALTSGKIELGFPTGATAIIDAPAIFQIADDTRLLLTTGKCSVYAPPGAEGLVVDTPMANVVDLGTRFVVDVDQLGQTRVQVVEGEADVRTKRLKGTSNSSATEVINLHEREARLLINEGGTMVRPIAFEEGRYVNKLPDRILNFSTTIDSLGGSQELTSVSVQRGNVILNYAIESLIGVDITQFNASSDTCIIQPSSTNHKSLPYEQTVSELVLKNVANLSSGLINIGGSVEPLATDPILSTNESTIAITPGMAIRFQRPIINESGPDFVVFELQTIVNPEQGDPFHVSPLRFSDNLRSLTVRAYDIDLNSPEAKTLSQQSLVRLERIPQSFEELFASRIVEQRLHNIRSKVLAVGVDLSDLGYNQGDSVEGLFLQDALDDNNYFDPVFIAGFPSLTQHSLGN